MLSKPRTWSGRCPRCSLGDANNDRRYNQQVRDLADGRRGVLLGYNRPQKSTINQQTRWKKADCSRIGQKEEVWSLLSHGAVILCPAEYLKRKKERKRGRAVDLPSLACQRSIDLLRSLTQLRNNQLTKAGSTVKAPKSCHPMALEYLRGGG